MNTDTNSTKMEPRAALRAIRRLIADPEDTAQVFEVIRALSGPSLEQGFRRFCTLPAGRKILVERTELLHTLCDRDYLRTLPPGSLGRTYLAFMERENLSADGLVEASEVAGDREIDGDRDRFANRLRDQHDLWHCLTRYGRDELGELCLLAFTYAQNRNRGIGFIVLVGMMQMRKHYGLRVFRAVRRGYRDGRRAAWLPGQAWEELLPQPVDAVRDALGIVEPTSYQQLRAEPLPA
ncbi:MAG: Coq4 family protein [Pseudomonadota bacterium]